MHTVREPAVAGTFYPDNKQVLVSDIKALMDGVSPAERQVSPKAMIVPHAGYIYSGQTAAIAYARLMPARHTIKRVVLLGPVHRVPVRGLALPDVDAFATPLGTVSYTHLAHSSKPQKPTLKCIQKITISPACAY